MPMIETHQSEPEARGARSDGLRLPTFLIGGAAKCATSSLAYYLQEHPDICMSRPKEVHFFDRDKEYARGLGHYARAFAHHCGQSAVGDATPAYLHGKRIIERIKADLPDVRLVFIFRDPVRRAYSHYRHEIRRGAPMPSFADSMDDPRCRQMWDRGHYARPLERYIEAFGRDRVLVLITEQLQIGRAHV